MNTNTKIIVGALVVAGVFFYAGMKYDASKVVATASVRSGQFGMGRGGQRGGFTSGQVLSIDGNTITLKLANGGSSIVLMGSSTPVNKSIVGSMADIQVGGNITVTGTPNPDGSITANSIRLGDFQNRQVTN